MDGHKKQTAKCIDLMHSTRESIEMEYYRVNITEGSPCWWHIFISKNNYRQKVSSFSTGDLGPTITRDLHDQNWLGLEHDFKCFILVLV